MKALASIVVAACSAGASPSPVCERARDQALENHSHYLAEVMAHTPDDDKPELQHQADREVASFKAKFVAACRAADDFKPGCFASPERERSPPCREFVRQFSREVLR